MLRKFLLLTFSFILIIGGSVSGQEISQKLYPQQFATIAAYETATGNSISSFQEAPMLAEMAAAGELPALEDRLPADPAVVEPLESVGVYGGELVGPATQPNGAGWDVLEMRLQKLLLIDTDLKSIIPNIAKSVEVSEDQRVYTITLRSGHKWSDGEPFKTEDFRFWFEDIIGNADLTPVPGGPWTQNGALPVMEIIDETTVSYTYPEPQPSLFVSLADEINWRGYRPAHYLKQFHIDYNPDAETLAADLGFDDWIQMFNSKLLPYNATWNLGAESDPYQPTLNSFVFVSADDFGNKLYERNPYFFKVDIAGNQLPYTDTLRRLLVEDLQVQDLRAIAGDYTHFGWGNLSSFPTYRENEEAGNYRTMTIEYSRGNEYAMMFNFTIDDPVLRELFWDVRFRQAMSLAINRDEINDLVYFGLATPSQAAPVPSSAFYEDWMSTNYAQYDPDLANQLLDELGLDQRDSEGFRLRPDGETLFINFQAFVPEDTWRRIGELVTSYWNDVGVKSQYKIIDAGLRDQLRDANEFIVGGHGFDTTDIGDYGTGYNNYLPHWSQRGSGVPWETWFDTDGEEGEEPPPEIQELHDLADQLLAVPFGSEEWLALGKELYTKEFEGLYMIGTIQRPPQPLLFRTNLRNTPPNDTQAQWSWSYRQWVMFMPEQWYFEPS